MKNPFEFRAPRGYPVKTMTLCTVQDQLMVVRHADAGKLREIIAWERTGKTIRKAAESRLRKLTKEKRS